MAFGELAWCPHVEQERPGIRQSLKVAFQNKPFVFGLLLFLMTWVAIDIVQSTLLFYVKYVVQREPQSDIIMAAIFVTGMLTLPIWNWLSGNLAVRWEPTGRK